MGDQFLAGGGNFSFVQSFQNASEAHPASYPVDTGGSFLRGKMAVVLKVTAHLHVM
jgi:hypothetical protein